MRKKISALATALTVLWGFSAYTPAATVPFELLTNIDNTGRLPQPQQSGGDYLVQTGDDISGGTINPEGCFSFNFMNPDGVTEPASYAKAIHSMRGSLVLDIDLQVGGAVEVVSLDFAGYIAPSKFSAQWLAEGTNSGTYSPSAAANWAFQASFDFGYDTPFAGQGAADITFDDYLWVGFIIPVSELTAAGMDAAALDDPLGYFEGNFEQWLLNQVAPRLPPEAAYLLFAQGQANPSWTNPMMDMTTDGIVGETVIAYAVPEPSTMMLLAAGFGWLRGMRRTRRSS